VAANANAPKQQQQIQQQYQPLVFANQPAAAIVAAGATSSIGQLDSQSTAAAELKCDDEDAFHEGELCVVCWEEQRSVALIHDDDAHLVSNRSNDGSSTSSSSSSSGSNGDHMSCFVVWFAIFFWPAMHVVVIELDTALCTCMC
jgi:hypothetical protein